VLTILPQGQWFTSSYAYLDLAFKENVQGIIHDEDGELNATLLSSLVLLILIDERWQKKLFGK